MVTPHLCIVASAFSARLRTDFPASKSFRCAAKYQRASSRSAVFGTGISTSHLEVREPLSGGWIVSLALSLVLSVRSSSTVKTHGRGGGGGTAELLVKGREWQTISSGGGLRWRAIFSATRRCQAETSDFWVSPVPTNRRKRTRGVGSSLRSSLRVNASPQEPSKGGAASGGTEAFTISGARRSLWARRMNVAMPAPDSCHNNGAGHRSCEPGCSPCGAGSFAEPGGISRSTTTSVPVCQTTSRLKWTFRLAEHCGRTEHPSRRGA